MVIFAYIECIGAIDVSVGYKYFFILQLYFLIILYILKDSFGKKAFK